MGSCKPEGPTRPDAPIGAWRGSFRRRLRTSERLIGVCLGAAEIEARFAVSLADQRVFQPPEEGRRALVRVMFGGFGVSGRCPKVVLIIIETVAEGRWRVCQGGFCLSSAHFRGPM